LTTSVPVRNVPYNVAVIPSNTETAVVDLFLGSQDPLDNCQMGEVFDYESDDCVSPQSLESGKTNMTLMGLIPQFFVITVPSGVVGSIKLSSTPQADEAADITFYVRRAGSPSAGNNDASGSSVVINYPKVGTYYVVIVASADDMITVDTVVEVCPDGKGGPGCSESYSWGVNNVSLTVGLSYSYFRVNVSQQVPLWFSVRSQNGTHNPVIFASRDQLPQNNNADLQGCNQQFCDTVSSIRLNVTTNQTWFISISGVNGTSYGLWFNSVCGPNCADHGDCVVQGPETGLCDCVADFIGVTCQITNGLGAQYIVLIIIASLVVASAVIGFVAWAYMRRKRVQYEHVG